MVALSSLGVIIINSLKNTHTVNSENWSSAVVSILKGLHGSLFSMWHDTRC